MSYSDSTAVQARAKCLDAATPDELAAGIAWADSVIDGRLAARYTVPFTSPPAIIVSISADLAGYYVIFEMNMAGGEDLPVAAALELKNRAYELLQQLQDGEMVLPVDSGADVSTLPPASILGVNPDPGVLRSFDLVNVPCTNLTPFTRPRRGVW